MNALDLFLTFFKIGAFTLGGGYAMIPLIEREVVDKREWIGREEFLDLVAVAQASPGPIAVNTAVFVGYKLMGIKGVIFSCLGSVLPSFIIIVLIAAVFTEIKNSPTIEKIFLGIRPVVAGMIFASVFRLGKSAKINRISIIFVLLVAISIWIFKITPIYIILLSIIVGSLRYLTRRNKI